MKTKQQTTTFIFFTVLIFATISAKGQSWTKIEGGIGFDVGTKIVLGKQNSFYTVGDYFEAFDTASVSGIGVTKYDTNGVLKWVWRSTYFNNRYPSGSDIALDNDENIYITGILMDSVKIGDSLTTSSPNASEEFFLSKVDSSKNTVWTLRAKSMDTTTSWPLIFSAGQSIEVSRQNKIYVLVQVSGAVVIGTDTIDNTNSPMSNFLIKMDTSGNAEWIRDCGCKYFEVDTLGNYYIVTSNILKKYDNAANFLWQRAFSFPVVQLDLNDWNQFYVVTDTSLHKININSGSDIWSMPIKTDYYQTINSDSAGNVIVSGMAIPATNPPYYAGTTFEQYSKTGNYLGHFYWGYPLLYHSTRPFAMVLQNNGSLFVFGGVEVTSTFPNTSLFVFGLDTLPNIANFDTYISKINVNDLLIGINDNYTLENPGYIVYPNPSTDKLFISQTQYSPIKTELTLFDLSGRQIFSTITNEKTIELNLSQLDPAIYLLQVKNKDGIMTTKIVKQ